MSGARPNAFILGLLLVLFLTAASDAYVWPFVAYDMFAGNYPYVRITGRTPSGNFVPIEVSQYFFYKPGYHGANALLQFLRNDPDRFAAIMRELRLRYNQRNPEPIDLVRVQTLESGKTPRQAGDYR